MSESQISTHNIEYRTNVIIQNENNAGIVSFIPLVQEQQENTQEEESRPQPSVPQTVDTEGSSY